MKKVLAWVLLLTLVLGAFAGCRNEEPQVTDPAVTDPADTGKVAGANDAIEYLKGFYKDDGSQTPVDYTRFGIVRVGGVAFDVVWTVDVGEDLIKVVVNDDGTVTIDINEECPEDTEYTLTATVTDAQGNTVSHSWTHILPKAQDMVEIVKAAYALAAGESLPYESRLIGKIISIDSIWSDEYQNITVSIEVTGAEDMPIKCYRMKSNDQTVDQIKDLKVGNIITVRGTLKNYEGTIEFDAGCILEKVEKGDAIDAPTDPGEILKAAYALAQDTALPYQATLTGTVIEIDTPYDPAYSNISVVIEVEGYPQYPILCYRLKGTGVDQIAVNDLITVTGIIKNYKGTIEYDSGCIMTERVSGGGVAQGPSSDAAKILSDAAKLDVGEKLPYRATLTGEIYSVDTPYDSYYNNVTVTIKVNGVKIQCYRMVGDGIDQIRETDTITVSGVIENYNGKLEFGKGCTLDSWSKGPRNVNYGPVSEDVAYKLYLDQKGISKVLYFDGTVSGTRLQTSEKGSKGVDVFAERVSGKGVRFYYMDGETKTYIEIEEYTNSEGKIRGRAIVTTSPSCYWVYISDLGVYAVNLPTAGKYFLGSYNTYETITASWCGYIDGTMSGSTQYIAKFIKSSDVPADDTPSSGASGVLVSDVQAGVPYKWGIDQQGLGSMLYFSGEMAKTYYGGTVEDINAAVNVVLEETTGGYYLSFTNASGAKKYINIVVSVSGDMTYRNFTIADSASTVYTYNSEYNTLVTNVDGTDCYLGTYGTFDTFSISTLDKIGTSYPAHFYTVGDGSETPDTPVVPDEPGDGMELVDPVAGTAYKFGMIQENVGTDVYYITGVKNGYYMDTTTDAAAAADVYLEETTGGYYLYTNVDGAKKYINMVVNGDHVNGMFEDAASTVYTYDAEKQTVVATVNDALYWFGTRSDKTYTTVGPVKVDYNGFYAKFYAEGESSEDPDVTEPETTEPEAPSAPTVVDPEVGTAYKFGMIQENVGTDVYYITGVKNGYYMDTTTDAAAAADVYLEETTGGYYLYTNVDGAKKYINMVVNGDHVNGMFEDAASTVYTYDAEKQTVVSTVNDALYWFGTRNDKNYTTIGPVKVDYNGFYAKFYAEGESSEDPDVTEPEATEPEAPSAPTVVDPEVGTAYKFGMIQENVGTDVYYITGVKNGYYMDTTTDMAAAADVYLEETTGGYYLYTNVDGAKKYINMVVNGDHVNGMFEDAASTVYTYDAEKQTVVSTVNDALYWFGTRNDKNYTTIGPVKVDYNGFYAKFYAGGESSESPSDPEESEPDASVPEDAEMMAVIFYDPTNSVAMTALNETYTYGYLPKTDITVSGSGDTFTVEGATEQNVFILVDNGDDATVKIMDCYGRYLYMTGTYNSFNVSAEVPESGADWIPSLNETEDGMYLTNALTGKTVGYSAQFTSFGVYPEEEKHTALGLIQVVFEDEEQPEETEPETGAESTVTYTFSNYGTGTQYVAESYDLDDVVSLDIIGCHMNKQLRIYQDANYDGNAIFTCTKTIKSLVINAGHKVSDLEVYGSVDGVTWELVETVAVEGALNQFADYTVEMPAGTAYKYLKLDAVSAQIRIPSITFTFGA